MLSEKYLAGLIDADGSIGIRHTQQKSGFYRPYLSLRVSQAPKCDKILYLLQEDYGGSVHYSKGKSGYGGDGCGNWVLCHRESRKLLGRIAKHLVVKQGLARLYLNYLDEVDAVSPEFLPLHREQLKEARKIKCPLPNFPARKWLAGYFDGDGCFASRLNKVGFAYLSARITAHIDADSGIRLIHKAFGGAIYYNKGPHLPMWCLHLEPSKAKQFVSYFAKHLVIKRAQGYFVLGCAKGGNYRDGHTIHGTLRQLKAQGQRLNEPEVDPSVFVKEVSFSVPDNRGIYAKRQKLMRESSAVLTA